jgi:4a-hydroxytetrahydrobiopterin dehydratase
MPRPLLATEEYIMSELEGLPLWARQDKYLVREFVAPNFASVIGLVNAIAILAEAMDHHPDILIYGWNKLRVTLSTHDRGGLTELDFRLAKKIEDLRV